MSERSVILGQCDFCERDVAHDERGATFVYDKQDLLTLEGIVCADCAQEHFGGVPPGWTPERYGAYLRGLAGSSTKAAAMAERVARGERILSEDIVGLLGLTPEEQRRMRILTTARERLRRFLEAEQRREKGRGGRQRSRGERG